MIRILIIIFLTGNSLFATIINVPDDYSTIQGGIDVSVNGDTVLVQPGTYEEHIDYSGKSIVVGSLTLTTGDTSYVSQTVIDGSGSNAVIIEYVEGETTELVGFSIQNGNRGIECRSSQPRLKHLRISDSSIGLMIKWDSNVSLKHAIIHGNGIAIYSSSTGYSPVWLDADSIIVRNNSNDQSQATAGLWTDDSTFANIRNSVFYNNTSTWSGAILNRGILNLTNVTIAGNTATYETGSGGIFQKADNFININTL